jgi:hypothetical protein
MVDVNSGYKRLENDRIKAIIEAFLGTAKGMARTYDQGLACVDIACLPF